MDIGSTSEIARRILALINSRPRAPTEDEIVAILEGADVGYIDFVLGDYPRTPGPDEALRARMDEYMWGIK